MKLKRLLLAFCIGFLALQSMACGDKAAKKIATEAPREGRDRELYAEGLKSLHKHRYEEGRILLNTLISTYDGSPYLPVSKLLIGDSFYREGGTSNWAQAEVEYREWLQFFPNHPLADDVLFKVAEIHVRQIDAPNRDWSQALSAERELMRFQREYPQSNLNEQVKERLIFVREQLGNHELNIARFYFKNRKAWNAVIERGKGILKKYPDFTLTDEALFLVGSALMEKEDTPEAAKYLARLVREFPNSKFRDKAAEFLERFGVAVPDPDPTVEPKKIIQEGIIKRKWKELFGDHMEISNNGIVLTKDDEVNPEVEAQLNLPKVDLTTPESTITDQKGVAKYGPKEEAKVAEASKPGDKDDKKPQGDTPTVKNGKDKKKKKGVLSKVLGRG